MVFILEKRDTYFIQILSIEWALGESTKRVHLCANSLADGFNFFKCSTGIPEARDSDIDKAAAPCRVDTKRIWVNLTNHTATDVPEENAYQQCFVQMQAS